MMRAVLIAGVLMAAINRACARVIAVADCGSSLCRAADQRPNSQRVGVHRRSRGRRFIWEITLARPAILVPVYFSCPNLCPMTLRHLTEGLNGIALRTGRDLDVIVASFDPRDTPADARRQKAACIAAYNHRDGAGWHFLVGSQPAIDQLTQAVGFHSTFDSQHGQFAHAVAIMVLTPQGKISHEFFGIDVSPADLESSLHDAQAGQATSVDQPDQQYCFAYDPSTSILGRRITRGLQALGVVWIAMIGGYISMKLTRELRAREGTR